MCLNRMLKELNKIQFTDESEVLWQKNINNSLKGEYMSKEDVCEKVRELCKEENIDFLFITEGKSCWSVSHDEHIRKVANFHKENEPN